MNSQEQPELLKLSEWSQLIPRIILEKAPIDLEAVGSYWGVKKIIKRDLGAAGLLYRLDKDRSVVLLKNDDSPGRQRFSWAHELGHIVMAGGNMPRVSCRKSNPINKALERSCEVIAAEILMPRHLFCSAANQYGWTLGAVAQLAQHFQVSVQATALRLHELATEPLLISAWRVESTPLLRLRLKWSRPNDLGKALKANVRWNNGRDALPPLYQAFKDKGVALGPSKVLMSLDGESKYRWVATEGLGVGKGANRTVLGFHYLMRKA